MTDPVVVGETSRTIRKRPSFKMSQRSVRFLWAVALLAFLGVALVLGFVVALASGETALYERNFVWLFWINAVVALALLIVLQQFVLSPAQLEAWGWRIPFFIGALCALVAMRMRSHMEETQSFTAAKENKKRGTLSELAKHPRAVATVVGLTLGGTVAFYTYSIYMQKFLANTVGLSKDSATLVSGATLLLFAMLQPIVGGLSDRIGRRPILISFGVLGTLFTVPIMTGISQTTNVWTAFFLIMAALVIVSGYTSINAVVKAELFPAEVRALGVGLPYALTVSIFGGTAEYIALWLKQAGHESLFYWYVTGTIFVSLMVYVFMRDTRTHSRIEH